MQKPLAKRPTSIPLALLVATATLVGAHAAAAPNDADGARAGRDEARPPAQRVEPARVPGEVFVILASEAAGEIAPELASMPALRQPPFNAFHSMRLLARPTVRLTMGEPETIPLPNGRILQLVVEERTAEGRYRVRVSINRPEQRDYLPLLEIVAPPGDPFFLAGQSFMGGTLVLGVRLGERPAR